MTRGGLWGLLHRHIGVRAEGMILAAAIWGLIRRRRQETVQ